MTLPAVPTDGLLPRPSARPGQPSLTTQRALPRSAYRRTRRHLRAAVRLAAFLVAAAVAGCAPTTGGAPPSTASPWSSNTTTEVSSPTTTIGLVADFGNCADGERAVASMINSWKVDAVVTAGDNTYVAPKCEPFTNSVGNYYGQYFSTDKGPAFFPALGNHDYDNVGAGLDKYNAIFHFISTTADAKRRWYDVKISGIHVFVLDNYAPPADLALQQTWLKQALATAQKDDPAGWRVVVVHTPPYSSGVHPANPAMQPSAGWDYRGWGADVVIAGHQHIYEDVIVDGFHYITAGLGTNGAGEERPCPTTYVSGSRICVAGPGALRLAATAEAMSVAYHQPKGGASAIADVVTFHRSRP